jgi:hypothetical protein
VYSTCSIAPEENDAVVEKLLRTVTSTKEGVGGLGGGGGGFRIEVLDPLEEVRGCGVDALLEGVELTRYGAMLLPDKGRFGPLYWAVLRKDLKEEQLRPEELLLNSSFGRSLGGRVGLEKEGGGEEEEGDLADEAEQEAEVAKEEEMWGGKG